MQFNLTCALLSIALLGVVSAHPIAESDAPTLHDKNKQIPRENDISPGGQKASLPALQYTSQTLQKDRFEAHAEGKSESESISEIASNISFDSLAEFLSYLNGIVLESETPDEECLGAFFEPEHVIKEQLKQMEIEDRALTKRNSTTN